MKRWGQIWGKGGRGLDLGDHWQRERQSLDDPVGERLGSGVPVVKRGRARDSEGGGRTGVTGGEGLEG